MTKPIEFPATPKKNSGKWCIRIPNNVVKALKLERGEELIGELKITIPLTDFEKLHSSDTCTLTFRGKTFKWGDCLAVWIKSAVLTEEVIKNVFIKGTQKTPIFSLRRAETMSVTCPHCKKSFDYNRTIDTRKLPTID